MWSSNNVLSKYKIYTNLHIYNCSWHFRVHLQYARHCKWFFAHLQFLHFAVLQLQTATALCKLPSTTFDVHCSIKLSFLINHPQFVGDVGVFWDKVFPHFHPLWYALLRQCNVKASCDGGGILNHLCTLFGKGAVLTHQCPCSNFWNMWMKQNLW